MRTNKHLKIGVLGGMGPEASVAFYNRVIILFQSEQQARFNFEYPEMLIHNIPSPDNVETGVDDELIEYLLHSVQLLEAAGMEMLVIPCNSAHIHIDAVVKTATVPVMNILEETAKAVSNQNIESVLILGTKSTLRHNIYPPYLERHGIRSLIPEHHHQEQITQLIMSVCDGTVDNNSRAEMLDIIAEYPQAQGVILGCTEIPMIVCPDDMNKQCFDTAEILARASYEKCLEGNQ